MMKAGYILQAGTNCACFLIVRTQRSAMVFDN